MKDIIIIGGGGHAKVVISIINKLKTYNIIGYTDILNNGKILSVNYLGTDNEVLNYSKQTLLALGIGQINNQDFRRKIVNYFIDEGYHFATLVSPDSILNEDVNIGIGTVIMDGVIINCCTAISDYSIINTKVSVDHDCLIGEFVHIAPGTTVCGNVIINDGTFVGAGTTIINNIELECNSFIKAGKLVKESK